MYKGKAQTARQGCSIGRKTTRNCIIRTRAFIGNNNDAYLPPVSVDVRRVEDVRTSDARAALFGNKRAPSIHIDNSTISYSDFLAAIKNGYVSDVVVSLNGHIAKVTLNVDGSVQDARVVFPEGYDMINFLVSQNLNVRISEKDNLEIDNAGGAFLERFSRTAITAIQIMFQVALITMIISILASRGGSKGGMFGMTDSKATLFDPAIIETRFSDVAGAENAKRELSEIVDFLKNPEKYTRLGARIPKGVLLYGPPGCGKTLLARSVAGEADVPFFSTAGSSMVEMFVGVAAARIRDMFAKAKEKAPCIIFIDEIDAIGKSRSMTLSSNSNDERDQALNQLLTEMDGFEANRGVIVIAATNRPDILDDALTRPGRFDRRVSVEFPDVNGRREILGVHTRGMPLGDDVDLGKIARNTIGFTGADLQNLCNEAAMYAARSSSDAISYAHFDQSLEKLTLGEKHSTAISDHKKKLVAYHEAGHALVGLIVNDFDTVRKISIIPRGNSGGATYFEPSEDRVDGSLMTREYLENKLAVALGGRVAEEIIFGKEKTTTGASGDFQVVAEIAEDMVFRYGFNEELGPMYISEENASVDAAAEVRLHVERAYQRATTILKDHEFYLHRIAEALIEKETLNEPDILRLVNGICCKIDRSTSLGHP